MKRNLEVVSFRNTDKLNFTATMDCSRFAKSSTWRTRDEERNIEEKRSRNMRAFMVSGFHPSQMDEVVKKINASDLFVEYGMSITECEFKNIFIQEGFGGEKIYSRFSSGQLRMVLVLRMWTNFLRFRLQLT